MNDVAELVAQTIDLSKRFGKHRAVDSLGVEVQRGSVYGLLGPNGAGKTTLLKMLVGLLRPTEGEVRLFGEPWRRGHLGKVGTLIEAPALYGHLTGSENLEVHRRLLGLPKKRIYDVLGTVDLLNAQRKKVSAYSLGMKQRLGIAVALIGEPELLILDEPTNGLDPQGIRGMRALIRAFSERGITVIVSSHILSEVAQVVSHVGIIGGGELRYQGTLSDLLREGEGYLEVRTDSNDTAAGHLRGRFPDSRLEDGSLLVPVAEEEAADVIGLLRARGVRILAMDYRKDDLESLFLDLVGEGNR